jgi:hypothetical protein
VASAGREVSRHPDPIVRRFLVYDRAQVRVKRRVAALIDYLDAVDMRHPDPETRRLDDLLGEADRLRRALT